MYKVYLLLLTFTKIVIQFTHCTTMHNIAILHKIAINMMQNKVNKVMILHNNNSNNDKMSVMYNSLKKNECCALGLGTKGVKRGTNMIGYHWWGRDTWG